MVCDLFLTLGAELSGTRRTPGKKVNFVRPSIRLGRRAGSARSNPRSSSGRTLDLAARKSSSRLSSSPWSWSKSPEPVASHGSRPCRQAAIQPLSKTARLPNISKYCVLRGLFALASAKE